jgi:hypothetical protein
MKGTVQRILAFPLILAAAASIPLLAQDSGLTFRASVARVTLSVTVRTPRGRPVTTLKATDFALYDSGQPRVITDFKLDPTPVSLGFLVDFSGSMGVGARRSAARENMHHLLSWLTPGVDRACASYSPWRRRQGTSWRSSTGSSDRSG